MPGYYLGIDVGTGSARAGVFDRKGTMLGTGRRDIETWRPQADFVEQSSDNIWDSCRAAVIGAIKQAGVEPVDILGIGFDATCSLVLLDDKNQPVSVNPCNNDKQNVVVWMDHRAIDQANRINDTQHEVLRYVGGAISPEMQIPKLLWLKENMPESWGRTAHFFDLPDFLVYRATGEKVRSLCSTVCKWTYMGHLNSAQDEESVGCWDDSFFSQVGLGELTEEGYSRIGQTIRPVGEPVGSGLTAVAAQDLGLLAGTPVATSIIDAHAGGLGVLGVELNGQAPDETAMERRLALIGGTSSCHMAVSRKPRYVPGVWGPYKSAMLPDMWLSEGGQSATGALIDHVIFTHARSADLRRESDQTGRSVYEILNGHLDRIATAQPFPAILTRDLHVLPYHHGNRSPRANPTLRGMVSGLRLSDTINDLALLYLATIQAIAHGTRHIIDTMNSEGYDIDTIFACGGGTRNPVFLREHADITRCQVVLPAEPEAVLLGSAILGATAAGTFPSVPDAMAAMNRAGVIIEPKQGDIHRYHDAKHRVFLKLHEDLLSYNEIMNSCQLA